VGAGPGHKKAKTYIMASAWGKKNKGERARASNENSKMVGGTETGTWGGRGGGGERNEKKYKKGWGQKKPTSGSE